MTVMKKNVIVTLMFCMFVNFLVPRFAIEPGDFDVLSKIIKSQSTLLYFFSMTTFPMKVVDDLFTREMSPTQRNESRSENKTNKANTSSDFSLVTPNNGLNLMRSEYGRSWTLDTMIGQNALHSSELLYRFSGTAPGTGVLFVCAVMFFFLRPRSAIDDLLIFSYRINRTQLTN